MCFKTFKIQINGRVQGVGFRPFVFNLAKEHNLKGSVSNNAEGVVVFINAPEKNAKHFLEQIIQNNPDVAVVLTYSMKEVSPRKFDCFSIVPSKANTQINIPLTPDFAVCPVCKAEIKDRKNRRYNYAFTTCVHCGPRYAVTTQFPFEREHTTLTNFKMCGLCNSEYTDPSNRRFHSQTNSCPECGIVMKLTDSSGNTVENNQLKILKRTAELISEGSILAIKNTNGYLLCCDATNKKAVQKLRVRKKRLRKPFAVMYSNIEMVRNGFRLSPHEKKELQSKVAPIVILQNNKTPQIAVKEIAPGLNQTGVMLPSSSLMELITQECEHPLIATSGNIHGSPIISNAHSALKELNNIADFFLGHNLKIEFSQDDSVVRFAGDKSILLRRSRGLAPNYLKIETQKTEPILAMGAHLKSTFALVPNTHIYVSQFFGNLDNFEVLERYKNTIKQFTDLFGTTPKTILVDKHPHYQSSIAGKELSEKWKTKLIGIQHHKAHFASVLGEHNLFNSIDPSVSKQEKILGVVWDGTGLGDDNNIWGGEFFVYEDNEINRLTHFEYFDWIANDKMAKEPRLALLCLSEEKNRTLVKDKFSETEWKIYTKKLKNNALRTSSVGRLFDAVASALDIVDLNTFEAEAAMLLEDCARSYNSEDYIDFLKDKTYTEIPSKSLIASIINTYKNGASKAFVAGSFLFTLATVIIDVAKRNRIKTVACSGGVFQNTLLVAILDLLTTKENISLKINRKLSANDENVSFGQLMYFQNIKN